MTYWMQKISINNCRQVVCSCYAPMVLWSFNYCILIDSAGYKIVITKKAKLQKSKKQDKMQSMKHSKPICWGDLLLLLLWLAVVRMLGIIGPFSFYPSEIFLSIVPLGKFPTLHIKIAYQIIRVSENNSDDSIHNLDNSCAWARLCSLAIRVWVYCHSLKLSDVPVCFFWRPWIREILYVLVSSEKQ